MSEELEILEEKRKDAYLRLKDAKPGGAVEQEARKSIEWYNDMIARLENKPIKKINDSPPKKKFTISDSRKTPKGRRP